MSEEERAKCRIIVGELSGIINKLNSFENDLNNLKSIIDNGILIDNKIPDENGYRNIINNTKRIKSNVTNTYNIVASKV